MDLERLQLNHLYHYNMTSLDVITLEQAKTYLVMDGIGGRDAEITMLIKSAVSLVEKYTDYRLYQRSEEFVTYSSITSLTIYPVSITSVKNSDGANIPYRTTQSPLQLNLFCAKNASVVLQVGYAQADIGNIPQNLITACYKIITYLFENKDAYEVGLPMDVQLLLNEFRRSATI